jgi:hypothetical protein
MTRQNTPVTHADLNRTVRGRLGRLSKELRRKV